eukprot:7099058-Pyramimonas_sp.AAC.1
MYASAADGERSDPPLRGPAPTAAPAALEARLPRPRCDISDAEGWAKSYNAKRELGRCGPSAANKWAWGAAQ